MRHFFSGIKFKILLAVFAALFLGILIAAVSGSGASPVSSALGVVMSPLNRVAERLQETFADFRAEFRSASYYREELVRVQEENASFREQLVDYEKALHKLGAY